MPILSHSNYLTQFVGTNNCSNLGLELDKLSREIDEERETDQKDQSLLRRVSFSIQKDSPASRSYRLAFERRADAFQSDTDAEVITIRNSTPLMIGTGNPNVHEIGVTLLRPWSIPCLPASAIKGCLSGYLSRHGGADWSRKGGVKSDLQVEVFGGVYNNDSYIGGVQFVDAWLDPDQCEESWFVRDIITPHTKEYQAGMQAPDGMENPVPVQTVALKPGLRFHLLLIGDEVERSFLRSALKSMLAEEGVGAKTSVGYGRFEVEVSENELQNAEPNQILQWDSEDKKFIDRFRSTLEKITKQWVFNETNSGLLKKLHPAKALCFELMRIRPTTLQDAKGIRDKVAKDLRGNSVNLCDPDHRAVFDACRELGLVRSRDSIANSWLESFAYGWEHVGLNDDNILNIIDEMTATSWPPASELDLNKVSLSEAARKEADEWLQLKRKMFE